MKIELECYYCNKSILRWPRDIKKSKTGKFFLFS
jgi:hypothetical protein